MYVCVCVCVYICIYVCVCVCVCVYIYDISSLRVNDLTLILLTWRKWCSPNNASKWQMGFNSGFKGLKHCKLVKETSNKDGIQLKYLLTVR